MVDIEAGDPSLVSLGSSLPFHQLLTVFALTTLSFHTPLSHLVIKEFIKPKENVRILLPPHHLPQ
jgi:hypothetical protein